MILSVQEFSVAVGTSRAAVYKARDIGVIEIVEKKIDTRSTLNSMWIKKDDHRRSSFDDYKMRNGISEDDPVEDTQETKESESEDVQQAHQAKNEQFQISDDDTHVAVVQKTAVAKMLTSQETYIGKKLDNLERRNELAPRQTMEFIVSRMANMITSGIKVVAQTGLTDIGKEKGITYTNEEFQILENACLEMVNRSLESIQKEIENNF